MTRTLTGHIITVPAHLIPAMYDDWRMDTIHETNRKGRKTRLTVNGYDVNDDGDICVIHWQTWNGTMATVEEIVAPDTALTVWVPSIPEALAAELA